MKVLRTIVQALLVILVLGAGTTTAVYFIKNRIKAKRKPVKTKPPLVDVIEVAPSTEIVNVKAMGNVVPATRIELQPQVSGRVVSQSENLVDGARFAAGETMLQIDRKDYEFAVEQMKAKLEQAKVEVAVEKGRRTVAQREWKLLESDVPTTTEGRELALRKPHMQRVQAQLDAAKTALAKAKLDLERTTIKAPFNALVLTENVDLGQLVSPQTRLATLIGTDKFYVKVTVPVNRLSWISLPTVMDSNNRPGAKVTIVQSTGEENVVREGRVIRLLGDISPTGRMARLLVQVDDPLGIAFSDKPDTNGHNGNEANPGSALNSDNESSLPLLLGAYVRVIIEGKPLNDVFEVPRRVIREGDRVWVMDDEDCLDIRPVKIAWRREDTVLVSDGLKPGERVVVSRIPTPLPGKKLRVQREDTPDDEAESPSSTDAPRRETDTHE